MAWETKLPRFMPARHGVMRYTQGMNALLASYHRGWIIEQLVEKHAIKIALHGKEQELVINGTNYTSLLYNLS